MTSLPTPLPKPQAGQPCSCGSGKNFEGCCGPVLSGAVLPPTAEHLMRARFTAHVAGDARFLHRTYAESARLPYVDEPDTASYGWSSLVVHSHELGAKPDTAFVDFSAHYVDGQNVGVLQEKSEFRKIAGEWIFTKTIRQGPAPIKAAPKVGRNDPCPCGSGKKHKQCCL